MKNHSSSILNAFLLSFLLCSASAFAQTSIDSVHFARSGTRGMVVADDEQAATWGVEILRRGGNAIDAAVATAFGMAVTRPHYAALGGGGFLVFCPAPLQGKPSACQVIDFREKAPAAARREMYIRNGKADSQLSRNGALASGVPGVPAGLILALEKFGSRSRKELLSKPIQWAHDGVRVSTNTEIAAKQRWQEMNPEARRIFSCGHETSGPCKTGELLQQRDLARVLRSIAKHGLSGFYSGPVGKKIVAGIQSSGGILSLEDLERYTPTQRSPIVGQFKGFEVVTMPPPSSGGTVLLQLLGYMERAERAGQLSRGFASVPALHASIHAMSLAFADRTEHMGDSDFYPVPLEQLLSGSYLDMRWKSFQAEKAQLPEGPGKFIVEPSHTTHFSVIDAQGNAVAITETVNDNFGSGFVPPGTGIVMNNQMDDFSAQPGVPNLFGLVGAEANAIAPGKRPLSSMSPTVVRDQNGVARIVLGAAGGPRIITSVFQTLVNRLQFGLSLADAVAAPRIHHQWKPQTVRVERIGVSPEIQEKLSTLGYTVEAGNSLAVVHALERRLDGRVVGAPDTRGEGYAVAE